MFCAYSSWRVLIFFKKLFLADPEDNKKNHFLHYSESLCCMILRFFLESKVEVSWGEVAHLQLARIKVLNVITCMWDSSSIYKWTGSVLTSF